MKLTRLVLSLFACSTAIGESAAAERGVPKPLPQNPGHIFLAGSDVRLSLSTDGTRWTLVDYDENRLAEPSPSDGETSLGKLPAGFYRLRSGDTNQWISLAVIEPLRVPTPSSSPIGLDVAMAWFYPPEKMDAAANLCALAGVNWVRDRLRWTEMEPERGTFSAPNKNDASATAQSQAGLRVLQVIHLSPPWANPNGKRFPLDLRDAHRFFQEMARRWRGQVQAFEPWNEADISMFGGHTGAEMAALQKASYLGLKSGNPNMVACLNVFATHNTNQLADLDANEAWPYFDTYNLHHYEAFDHFPRLYADHRAISAGRPLWVSECAVPVKWAGDAQWKEPTDADLKVQAERVAKTFACSLHEGSAATFYFLLPHYVEGQTQFGIVRPDLTPRPAYVALAAVGRWLADAKPLGRVRHTNAAIAAYLFRAKPDGHERDVLVAWTAQDSARLELASTSPAETVLDHLGRPCKPAHSLALTSAPLFVVLPKGSARHFSLLPPPTPAPRLQGEPSPIVFQTLWPEDKIDLGRSAYLLPPGASVNIPVFAYNFGDAPARGELHVQTPAGWEATFPASLEISPGDRKQLALQLRVGEHPVLGTVRVRGDFGRVGESVLSVRMAGP